MSDISVSVTGGDIEVTPSSSVITVTPNPTEISVSVNTTPVASVAWGDVTGDINNQTDLITLIDEQGVPAGGTTGQVLTKTSNTDYDTEWAAGGGGAGTVTSVALTVPTGFSVTGSPVTTSGTLGITTALSGVLKGNGSGIVAATPGTDYEVPLTFSTGLTRSTNTVTVNTSQNIGTLSNLTTNGFVKTSGGGGTLSIDTSTYITGNQTITLSGAVTGSGTTAITTTLAANQARDNLTGGSGTLDLSGYTITIPTLPVGQGGTGATTLTGILKGNGTSAFSAASSGTDYVAPGAITASGLTMATSRLLGRTTGSSGAVEEITAGSGLSLSAGSVAVSFGTSAGTAAEGNDTRITGAAQKASNLSDLANVATAFGNIKQAATTSATGVVELATDGETASGVVVQGNDSRLVQYAGEVVQTLQTTNVSWTGVTTAIPFDDTIPLVSEGTQILSQAITLRSSSNKVLVIVSIPFFTASALESVAFSAYRDSTHLDTTATTLPSTYIGTTEFTYLDTPAGNVTYTVRFGPSNGANTAYINGNTGGRVFGGGTKATLTLMEIRV